MKQEGLFNELTNTKLASLCRRIREAAVQRGSTPPSFAMIAIAYYRGLAVHLFDKCCDLTEENNEVERTITNCATDLWAVVEQVEGIIECSVCGSPASIADGCPICNHDPLEDTARPKKYRVEEHYGSYLIWGSDDDVPVGEEFEDLALPWALEE